MAGLVQKYQEMAERVQMATSSQAEFEMVQQRLLTTANGTYRSLQEAQELYIRTADSLRSMQYTTNQAIDVQDSMSYAFVKMPPLLIAQTTQLMPSPSPSIPERWRRISGKPLPQQFHPSLTILRPPVK